MYNFQHNAIINKDTKVEKIGKWIGKGIGALLFSLALTFVLSLVLGYRYMTVLTSSMHPTLPVGTVICIHKVDVEDLEVGDIITWGSEKTAYVTHRIVRIEEDGSIITKGDASPNEDGVVSPNRIQGKVVFHSSLLGSILTFLQDPFKIILLVVGVGLTYFVIKML